MMAEVVYSSSISSRRGWSQDGLKPGGLPLLSVATGDWLDS
jgi:hypothetical protein